jgi:hypothetical protein
MIVLTEEMVTQGTRRPLGDVEKLNLWARGLCDVSILSTAEKLEILCLSSNKIKTLQNFPVCPVLTQLILRNNQIADLGEVQHLAKLPRLHLLWLAENPIEKDPQYVEKVLAALPGLIQLDGHDVSDPALRSRLTSRQSARQEPRPPSFPDLPEPDSGDATKPAGQSQKLAGPPQKPAPAPPQAPAGQSQKVAAPPQKPAPAPPQAPAGQRPVKKLLDTKQLISRQVSDLPDPASSRRIPRETEERILSAVLGLLLELNHESLDKVIFRCRKLSEQ